MEEKDLTGNKFGKLLPLYPERKNGRIFWVCRCDCGKEVSIRKDSLISGHAQSCGCSKGYKKYDLTNKKFTKLLVIGDSGKRNINREIIWKCQCDCGNIVYVNTSHLTSNHTKSCGCLTKSKGVLNIIDVLTKNNIDFELEKTF